MLPTVRYAYVLRSREEDLYSYSTFQEAEKAWKALTRDERAHAELICETQRVERRTIYRRAA